MVRLLLLAAVIGAGALGWGWELRVAFTNDLHASLARLPLLEPYLRDADLLLDAGDAWEDLYRFTDLAAAGATARWMGAVGYDAMVLGNHDAYLGPALRDVLDEVPFPAVVTNARGLPGTVPWALLERKGLRILVLGFLGPAPDVYFPYPLWPKAELRDPAAAAREALASAPDHDLLIALAHMTLDEARELARALPGCDLLILGHDHLFLDEPVWVGTVPIVQAGHRAQAVGRAMLGPGGLADYELVRVDVPRETGPSYLLPSLSLLGILLLLASGGK